MRDGTHNGHSGKSRMRWSSRDLYADQERLPDASAAGNAEGGRIRVPPRLDRARKRSPTYGVQIGSPIGRARI